MSRRYEKELQQYWASLTAGEFARIHPIGDGVERKFYDLEFQRRISLEDSSDFLRAWYAQMTPEEFAATKPVTDVERMLHQGEAERRKEMQKVASAATPHGLSCPKCSKTTIREPIITWKWFQTSLLVFFMSLFTINRLIEQANKPKFAPEDYIFNPWVQRAPKVYVPPDYSLLYIVGALGLCIVVFLFISALSATNTCEACGYRWKNGATAH